MTNKTQAYTSLELYAFKDELFKRIEHYGLPKGYASGLPYHEAKKNFIKEHTNAWISNRKKIFTLELQKKEEARLRELEEAHITKANNLKTEEESRIAESNKLKAEEEVRIAKANKLKAKEEARIVESNKLKAEEEARIAKINKLKAEEEAHIIESNKLKDEENARIVEANKLKDEENARIVEANKLKDEENARIVEANKLKDEENARIVEANKLKDEEEDARIAKANNLKSEEEALIAESNKLKAEEEARIAKANNLKAEEEARIAEEQRHANYFHLKNNLSYNKIRLDHYVQQEEFANKKSLEAQQGIFNINSYDFFTFTEKKSFEDIQDSINKFSNDTPNNALKNLNFHQAIEKSLIYLKEFNNPFNIYQDNTNSLLSLKTHFQNVYFSDSYSKAVLCKTHKNIFQEILKNINFFLTNKIFHNFSKVVENKLLEIYNQIGNYLLYLHYVNAKLVSFTPPLHKDNDISLDNVKELIFQTSILFIEIIQLQSQCKQKFLLTTENSVDVLLFKNILSLIHQTILNIFYIYNQMVMNNDILFISRSEDSFSNFSVYLSSSPPDLDFIINNQRESL